jgi:hypothetical protein
MILITEDELEIVITFILLISTLMEIAGQATQYCPHAFVDSIVGDRGCDLQSSLFVEHRNPGLPRPHHETPELIDLFDIVRRRELSLPALLLRQG